MKLELMKIGKTLAFQAGKYMPKALIGVSAGATAGGIYLAVQAGMEFQRLKDSGEEITWKDYARIFGPCVAAGVFAIACAFGGLTESEKRYAAAAALASMYESREKEIEAKAREIFGDNEVNKMHDEIAKDKLKNAPEPLVAYGGTAFLDLLTGQYIYMDLEAIRSRINNLNEAINQDRTVTRVSWCDAFGLYSTPTDEEVGWSNATTGNIKYSFTYTVLDNGRTVAALDVSNPPELIYEPYNKDSTVYNPGWDEV